MQNRRWVCPATFTTRDNSLTAGQSSRSCSLRLAIPSPGCLRAARRTRLGTEARGRRQCTTDVLASESPRPLDVPNLPIRSPSLPLPPTASPEMRVCSLSSFSRNSSPQAISPLCAGMKWVKHPDTPVLHIRTREPHNNGSTETQKKSAPSDPPLTQRRIRNTQSEQQLS